MAHLVCGSAGLCLQDRFTMPKASVAVDGRGEVDELAQKQRIVYLGSSSCLPSYATGGLIAVQ